MTDSNLIPNPEEPRHFEVMGYPEYREPTTEERIKWPGVQRIITKMNMTGITEVYRPANPDAKELMLQAGARGRQEGKDLGRQIQMRGGEAQSLTSMMEGRSRERANQRLAVESLMWFLRSFGVSDSQSMKGNN